MSAEFFLGANIGFLMGFMTIGLLVLIAKYNSKPKRDRIGWRNYDT